MSLENCLYKRQRIHEHTSPRKVYAEKHKEQNSPQQSSTQPSTSPSTPYPPVDPTSPLYPSLYPSLHLSHASRVLLLLLLHRRRRAHLHQTPRARIGQARQACGGRSYHGDLRTPPRGLQLSTLRSPGGRGRDGILTCRGMLFRKKWMYAVLVNL